MFQAHLLDTLIEVKPAAGRFKAALLVASSCVLLAACGGSGGGSSSSGNEAVASKSGVSGRAVKGVIGDARIDLFPVTPAGQPAGSTPTETTNTEADGSFTLPEVTEPSLVMSVGGSFVDEADQDPEGDGRNQIDLGPNDAFESVLFPGETTVAITPFTQLLVDKARREVTGDNFQQVIAKNRQIATDAFGFDPFTTMPADPTAPGSAPLNERRYALVIGGIANAINRISIEFGFAEPRFEIIQAVIADLSDGVMDGLENGQSVTFTVDNQSFTLPTNIRINEEITRFGNNNFDAYNGLKTDVNESTLSGSGANEAPISIGNAGFSITEGGNRAISLADLAVSDPDAGPEALSFSISSFPVRGELTLNGAPFSAGSSFTQANLQNGDVTYSDLSTGDGTDTFSLVASDGADDLTITVNISIGAAAANQPPIINGSLSFSVEEDDSATLNNDILSANDPDNGPQALQFFLEAVPANGVLRVAGNPLTQAGPAFTPAQLTSGDVTYSASPGTGGSSDSIQIAAGDGENSAFATIGVSITSAVAGNTAPIATDGSIDVDEGGSVSGTLDATDADGDSLTFFSGVTGPTNGSLDVQSDGSFTYAHDGSETTSLSFNFLANDGTEDSNQATFIITINPVNDAPVSNSNGFNVEIGHSKVLTPGDFEIDDPDSDPNARSYSVDGTPPNGKLRLNGVGLGNGDSFTEANLIAGNVSYKHDGTPGDTGFQINIDDGSGAANAVANGGIPVQIDGLNVADTEYHTLYFYPQLETSFNAETGNIGKLDFSSDIDSFSTDDNGAGPLFNFTDSGAETGISVSTSNGTNYFARLESDASSGDVSTPTPLTVTVHGELQFLLPTEREFNQNGTDEIVQARSIRFIPADLEFGITLAGLEHTFTDFGTTELNNDGGLEELDVTDLKEIFIEQDLFLLVEKSTSASDSTLSGTYGFVEFGLAVNDGPAGEIEVFNLISTIAPNGSGTFTGGAEELSALQRSPANTVLLNRSSETLQNGDIEDYAVAEDGTVTFSAAPNQDTGFVSADGSLFFLPFSRVEQGNAQNLEEGENSVIIGVRADQAPILDEGASFRLQGVQVCFTQDGRTEIERFVRNSLSFNTSGVSLSGQRSVAIRPNDIDPPAFLPTFLNDSVNLSLSTTTGGELTLVGSSNGRDYQLNGYLADTGRMMIFNVETDDSGSATDRKLCQGIAIAVLDTGFDLDNTPPVATITGLPTMPLIAGDSVTLNANASTDADGDALSFEWFVTAGTLDSTTGNQVVYTAPSAGNSAARIYLTASDGDFQNVTFGTLAYLDPDPSVKTNQTGNVEQGHTLLVDNQLLLTEDADTDSENLTYTVDDGLNNGRLFLAGAAIGIGDTFTQDDVDNGALSYRQSGQALAADSFDFTVSDGNASESATFSFNVTPFNANMTLQGFGFLLGFEERDILNPGIFTGIVENASEAVFERDIAVVSGNQLQFTNRFTSEATDAELRASEDVQTSGGVIYSLEVEQEANPDDIEISPGTLLPSGLLRQVLDRVVVSVDVDDDSGNVLFPAAANFIPLDLNTGLYVVGFTEMEQEYGLIDTTGNGEFDSVNVDDPIEFDAGFFFDFDAERVSGNTLATLNGNYRSVSFAFSFSDPNNGVIDISNGLTDLVFSGTGSVSGGVVDRELSRFPGATPEVTRTSVSNSNAADGSSYTVSNEGLVAFTNPEPFTLNGFTTGDGSFYALQAAGLDGTLPFPDSAAQVVEYAVRVNSAVPTLSGRRFVGDMMRFCFGPEGDSAVERDLQTILQFNNDGSEVTIESLAQEVRRTSDTAGFIIEAEERTNAVLAVTTSANGGFAASVDLSGELITIDGALSENGRVMILRFSSDGTANGTGNCEGFGLAGADTGQEVVNQRPTITVGGSVSTVQKGQSTTLTATAADPDGTTPTIRWVATAGQLSPEVGATVTWTAPPAAAPNGTARIYATATDGDLPATSSVDIFYVD